MAPCVLARRTGTKLALGLVKRSGIRALTVAISDFGILLFVAQRRHCSAAISVLFSPDYRQRVMGHRITHIAFTHPSSLSVILAALLHPALSVAVTPSAVTSALLWAGALPAKAAGLSRARRDQVAALRPSELNLLLYALFHTSWHDLISKSDDLRCASIALPLAQFKTQNEKVWAHLGTAAGGWGCKSRVDEQNLVSKAETLRFDS